jgi:hypothetical protein
MNQGITFLLLILLVSVFVSLSASIPKWSFDEGFRSYKLEDASRLPNFNALLDDEFPPTDRKGVTANSYNDIWWRYPVFGVGSYAQITNNLRYRRNPDDGECRTAEFCGAMYRDNEVHSNYVTPLPPVNETCEGVRVNYYKSDTNFLIGQQPRFLPAF